MMQLPWNTNNLLIKKRDKNFNALGLPPQMYSLNTEPSPVMGICQLIQQFALR
jgi:hypothetical protein